MSRTTRNPVPFESDEAADAAAFEAESAWLTDAWQDAQRRIADARLAEHDSRRIRLAFDARSLAV